MSETIGYEVSKTIVSNAQDQRYTEQAQQLGGVLLRYQGNQRTYGFTEEDKAQQFWAFEADENDYQEQIPQTLTVEQIGHCYGRSISTSLVLDDIYDEARQFLRMLTDQSQDEKLDEHLFWCGFFRGIAANFPIVS